MTTSVQTPRSGPYSGDGTTVAFAYGFLITAESDLVVVVRNTTTDVITTKVLNTDYTVSGVDNPSGGTVTFSTAPTANEEVGITRASPLAQELDLQNRGVVTPQLIEDKLDDLYRIAQDQAEGLSRSIKSDVFNVVDLDQLTLYLNNLGPISSDITTVSGISGNVTTVAGISADVTTIAGISSDVTTVSGISADVTTVAADGADIGVVAGISADVSTVSGISGNVSTVAGISADVTTVSGISADVTTVAADGADIGVVAGISSDVTAVAAIDTDVTTVASNIVDVQNAAANAAAAAASAAAAATSETNAATSETNAAASAAAAAASEANLDLGAISDTISATAVDVFVYDTSKDSDGGAWRKRTQHTSWYQETLNTADRGGRREFPAVAVIVATSSTVTVYDADDPALPMWAVWRQASTTDGSTGWYRPGYSTTSVAAKNGVIAFGLRLSGLSPEGLCYIDLNKDIVGRYAELTSWGGFGFDASSGTKTPELPNRNTVQIVDAAVNDVAMTVLPDAPVDAATGLPVPTIAVATDGGVSVIKDDGAVYDVTYAGFATDFVKFVDDKLIVGYPNGNGDTIFFDPKEADITADYNAASAANFAANYGCGSYFNVGGGTFSTPALFSESVVASGVVGDGSSYSVGLDLGLSKLFANEADETKSLAAYITSDYNTGWMVGDIKGAFLSSTDTASLVASGELVTNGTFDTDTTGWTGTDANLTVSAGELVITATTNGNAFATQTMTVEVGKTYKVSIDHKYGGTVGQDFLVGSSFGASDLYNGPTLSADTTETVYVVATTTTLSTRVRVFSTTIGQFGGADNISVELADEDRSVNANGLVINGTITRSAVATGAELVAYSGFSASNYLEQPYNSDLDFGTGDFCVMGWMRQATIVSSQMVDRGNSDRVSGNGRITLLVNTGGSAGYQFFTRDGSGTGRSVSVGSLPQTNTWYHVCGVRTGGFQRLYINGVEVGTAVANTADLSNAAANLYVGQAWDGSNSNNGDLALLRIGATAPTADQIKKIYEDEKFLFQENADATLFGSSDAVTALAHDEVTDLLHVGTSAGRSDFSGLRRVNDTATAITTAISAHAGLVSEQ